MSVASPEWGYAFAVVWLVLACASAIHAVMYKRDPKGAGLWLFAVFTFPIFGAWLYWTFGINRIERRAERRLGGRQKPFHPPEDVTPHTAVVDHVVSLELRTLRRVTDAVTRLPLLGGNHLEPLHNGEQAYPAMLDAIHSAKQSITLASYIFDWDKTGRSFVEALASAARRGVRVHVLLDGVGAVYSFSRTGRALIKAGAQVAAFFPLRFPLGRLRLNLRNHRKILVVDGCIGFTGGMNISRRHMLKQMSLSRSEDLHFKVLGPVVAQMQQTFTEDWFLAKKTLLSGPDYFPELDAMGDSVCRGIISGPDENHEKIHLVLQGALASAERSVRIVTPYFVPSASIVSAMCMAKLRGVEVTLVLPSKVDLPYMRWAADAFLWQVLQHGVRVFLRKPPFVHTKLVIVDDQWFLLGSANIDRRSFRLNFEFNIEVYDEAMAGELGQWIDTLVKESEEVTLEDVDARPKWMRLRDGLVRLFAPYL